jgi:hypothetical protein
VDQFILEGVRRSAMKRPTGQGLIYETKQIRLCPPIEGEEAAIPIADLPTGRTSASTLQLIKNNPDFQPFLRSEEVKGPRKRSRQAQVLTTSGVRKLLEYLQNSKPQERHIVSTEKAIRFIQEELLPKLDSMVMTVGRPRGLLIGRPMGSVGKPPSITIKIGRASFSGDILHPDEDTVSVTSGKLSRTWTASQWIELMEHHRF